MNEYRECYVIKDKEYNFSIVCSFSEETIQRLFFEEGYYEYCYIDTVWRYVNLENIDDSYFLPD